MEKVRMMGVINRNCSNRFMLNILVNVMCLVIWIKFFIKGK